MPKPLRSRLWSCSELEQGNASLLRVKQEPEPNYDQKLDAELDQDTLLNFALLPMRLS